MAAVGVAVKSLTPADFSQENIREAVGEAQDALTVSASTKDDLTQNSSSDVQCDINGIREISIKDKEETTM